MLELLLNRIASAQAAQPYIRPNILRVDSPAHCLIHLFTHPSTVSYHCTLSAGFSTQ
jgi:hypothetical protein